MKDKSFQYTVERIGKYLLVTASGKQSSSDEVIDYAICIDKSCKRNKCGNVLLDEKNVYIGTNLEDELKISDFTAFHRNIPNIKKVACVPNNASVSNATFFQILARSKHFNFRVFPSIDEAAEWLCM